MDALLRQASETQILAWVLAGCPRDETWSAQFAEREGHVVCVESGAFGGRVKCFIVAKKDDLKATPTELSWNEFYRTPGSFRAWREWECSIRVREDLTREGELRFRAQSGDVLLFNTPVSSTLLEEFHTSWRSHAQSGPWNPSRGRFHNHQTLFLYHPYGRSVTPLAEQLGRMGLSAAATALINDLCARVRGVRPSFGLSTASVRSWESNFAVDALPAHRDGGTGVAILYLSSCEGGSVWIDPEIPGRERIHLCPQIGLGVSFEGTVLHGVHPMGKGQRLALTLVFSDYGDSSPEHVHVHYPEAGMKVIRPTVAFIDALRRIWNRFDTSGSGTWSEKEIREFLVASNSEVSDRMVNMMLSLDKHTKNGARPEAMCWEEFVHLYLRTAIEAPSDLEKDLKALGITLGSGRLQALSSIKLELPMLN